MSKSTGTIDTFSIANQTYSTTPFTFTAATRTGDGIITYAITTETDLLDNNLTTGSVATISETRQITKLRSGKVTITATLSETTNYTGATRSTTFTINKATGIINTFSITNRTYNLSPFTFIAPSKIGDGILTYAITTEKDLSDIPLDAGSVATIDSTNRQISMVRSGKVTVTATLSETDKYTSTTKITNFNINKAIGILDNFNIIDTSYDVSPYTFTTPSITGDGTITYAISAETDISNNILTPGSVATINSTTGVISMARSGKVTVTATLSETDKYISTIETSTFNINKATGTFDTFNILDQTYDVTPFNLTTPSIIGDGVITYAITTETDLSDTVLIPGSIATIDGTTGEITMLRPGKVTVTASLSETDKYTGGITIDATFVINKITGILGTFSISTQTYDVTPFTFTAPSITGDGTITYAITAETDLTDIVLVSGSVATINSISGAITMLRSGKVTVTATLSETTNYSGTTSVTTFDINRATSTLSAFSITDQTYDVTPFIFTAPSITGDGTITYDITTETDLADIVLVSGSVATINSISGAITMLRSGKVTVTATLLETDKYTSAIRTASFVINKAISTIDNFNIIDTTYDISPFNITAPTITGDGTITYAITEESDLVDIVLVPGSVATIDSLSGTITMLRSGKVTVTAILLETDKYTGGITTDATFVISKAISTIDNFNISDITYDVSPFNITAPIITGDSTINYAITEETDLADIILIPSSVATIDSSSGVISMLRSGKVTVRASLSETDKYTGGITTDATFVISKATGILNTLSIPDQTYNISPFTFTAPSTVSDGIITYAITEETDLSNSVLTPNSVATIDINTGAVTMLRSGIVTVRATLSATDKYTSATTDVTFTIYKAIGVLNTFTIAEKTYNVTPFSFTAPTQTSDGTISYTIISEKDLSDVILSNGSVATINSTTGVISMLRSGKVTVRATLSETDKYASATSDVIFSINKANSILGGTLSIDNVTFDPSNLTLDPTQLPIINTGDGSISYSITAETDLLNNTLDTGLVATINNTSSRISILRSGKVTVRATLSETDKYTSAITEKTFIISRASSTLGTLNITDKIYNTLPFTPTLPIINIGEGNLVYEVSNGTGNATINSATGEITMIKAGSVTIKATLPETSRYNSSFVQATFIISKANSQLSIFNIQNQTFKSPTSFSFTGPTIEIGNGSITYITVSDTNIATYNSTTGKIDILQAGYVTIRATLLETPQYNSTTRDATFTINKYPDVGELNISNQTISTVSFTITGPTKPQDHNGSWSYLTLSENISVNNAGIVTMSNTGVAEIQAILSSDGLYKELIITAKFLISDAGEQPSQFSFINSQEVENAISNVLASTNGITNITSDNIDSALLEQLNPLSGTIQEKSENKGLVIDTLFNIFGGVAITLPKNAIFIPDIFNLEDVENITLINTSSSTSSNPTIIDGNNISNKAVFLSAAKPNQAIELRGSGVNQGKSLKIIKIDQINYNIIKDNGLILMTELKQKGESILFAGFNVVLSSESIQLISVPGAPTNLVVTMNGINATLTWNAPSDNGGLDITDYLIQYTLNAGSLWTTFNHVASSLESITVPNLIGGLTYAFRVFAINEEGTSFLSSESAPITIPYVGTGGDPIIQPLLGPRFALASHIKYVNLLADYSNKFFVNGQVDMLKPSDFPTKIYWDNSFSKTSELTHMYANSYYRKFTICCGAESIEIDADTLIVTKLTPLNKLRVINFKPNKGIQSISFNKTYPLTSATKGIKIGFANYLLTIVSDINTDDRHYIELLNVKEYDLSSLCGALISKDKIIRISNLEGKELYEFDTNPFESQLNELC